MAQLMPLPLTVSWFGKIQIGVTFLIPADPGSPKERAVKRVCVCTRCLVADGTVGFDLCAFMLDFWQRGRQGCNLC